MVGRSVALRLCLATAVFGLLPNIGAKAAASIYTPENDWAQEAGTLPRGKPITVALRECLKANDLAAYRRYKKTGLYRTSGWLLPEPQTTNVNRCMRSNGWTLIPKHLYTP